MADPTTEAGEPPQCVLGTLFSQGRENLDFLRNGWEETQGSPCSGGLQSLGTVMVYNGADSKIPEGQGRLVWAPPRLEALLLT